jgi:hypothetical protein
MSVRFVGQNGLEQHTSDEIEDLLARDDGFVWLDLPRWDEVARPTLADIFHLHPLAIADCEERNRVPKMHAYTDHVLIVVHAPERGRRRGRIRPRRAASGVCPRWPCSVGGGSPTRGVDAFFAAGVVAITPLGRRPGALGVGDGDGVKMP